MDSFLITIEETKPSSVTLLFELAGEHDRVVVPLEPDQAAHFIVVTSTDPFPSRPGTCKYQVIETSKARGKPLRATIRTLKGRSRAKSDVEIPREMYLLIWNCWHNQRLPREMPLASKQRYAANKSFKPNPLRSFKTPSGSSGGSA
jgi:hypothetical protein